MPDVTMNKNTARKQAQRFVSVADKVCESCGKPHRRLHRHHEDHDKPLDVQILCPSCHALADAKLGNRHSRPEKTCVVCGAKFLEYTHSRVKTCGASCLAKVGEQNARKRWGDVVDIAEAKRLVASGMSMRQAANKLGTTHSTLSRLFKSSAGSSASSRGSRDDSGSTSATT